MMTVCKNWTRVQGPSKFASTLDSTLLKVHYQF